jgi:hypothetical protein
MEASTKPWFVMNVQSLIKNPPANYFNFPERIPLKTLDKTCYLCIIILE